MSLYSVLWPEKTIRRYDGRVVKAKDAGSFGLCPRRFEPCSCRHFFFQSLSHADDRSQKLLQMNSSYTNTTNIS